LKRLGPLLAAGAAAVATVWGLFSSVIKELVPPVEDAQTVTNWSSLITLLILFALVLGMPRNPTVRVRRSVAIIGGAVVALALVIYFMYRGMYETYVYLYPGESTQDGQARYIRGDYHEQGKQRAAGLTAAEAVRKHGGPDIVSGNNILWTEASLRGVEQRLVIGYCALVGTACTGLFSVAVAIVSTGKKARRTKN
jgi:hypothetical protein